MAPTGDTVNDKSVYTNASYVFMSTDGGTRSVMKVLFISFQKFHLEFFSCLAAQQL